MTAPKLRFKEFSGDWCISPLKNLCKINQGLQIAIEERFLEDAENRFFYITNEFLRDGAKKSYFIENPPISVRCKSEDILMTRTGNTGQVVTNVEGAFHNNFFKIDFDRKHIDKNFFVAFLRKNTTQHLILKYAGASTIPDLNHSDFYRIQMPITSIDEQTKIASFLSAVDEKISQLTQKHELLSQYKQGMMQKLFSQEIRFKADDGGEFGEWEEKLLSEIGFFKNGLNKDKESFGFGFPFVNLMDVFGKKIVEIDNLGLVDANQKDLENYDLKKGDVLFIRSSVKAEGVGQTALVINDLDNTVYSGFLIRFRDTYGLDLGFKKYCFMNNEFRLRLLAKSTTSANTNINQESLSALSIKVPCLEEQTQIANFLSSIDQKLKS
ncbi:restriction endonuclease subunit S [Acinetobacter johnsonii]|nr:restriction endonuclease subunit S [Acinetobacter johnsonii]UBQ37719.1 restriction endonuclease subunit S [Acinetobacter johnsonii]